MFQTTKQLRYKLNNFIPIYSAHVIRFTCLCSKCFPSCDPSLLQIITALKAVSPFLFFGFIWLPQSHINFFVWSVIIPIIARNCNSIISENKSCFMFDIFYHASLAIQLLMNRTNIVSCFDPVCPLCSTKICKCQTITLHSMRRKCHLFFLYKRLRYISSNYIILLLDYHSVKAI